MEQNEGFVTEEFVVEVDNRTGNTTVPVAVCNGRYDLVT